jgi:hypothetical protein
MILQAQTIVRGMVWDYENRECSTPREAAEFRDYFERAHGVGPDVVQVVSACGRLAVKVEAMNPAEAIRA